jgi:8-oxo-dGTP pyrophosphatase MutT (NUDIX family)
MSQPTDQKPTPPPRPAASIVLIRDGAEGLEVFMIERHQGAGLAFSGALVFPGGKVDDADHAAHWHEARPPSGEGPPLPFWIAAVRETFEEAGILLARPRGAGGLIGGSDAARLVAEARVQAASDTAFAELMARAALTPALDHLVHFGHWITPLWAPRRFDTHFFLVGAPHSQDIHLDEGESAAAMWMRPAHVLAEADAGKRSLVAVTRFTLELLDTWRSVEEATSSARRRRVVTVQPTREKRPEGFLLKIPEEAGYVRSELLVTGG